MSLDHIPNPLPQKWFSGVPLHLVHRADKLTPHEVFCISMKFLNFGASKTRATVSETGASLNIESGR